jgi:lipopolysaccharide transport system ATP-binding protein
MSKPGIVVDGVWKRFHRGELHDSLRDLIPAVARRLVGRGRKADALGEGDFWALRDLSFEVKAGEALGIIGPNGAGKSTLLKVLNRIIQPTRGTVVCQGRIGALIEVAAGFHPDLTGRENVFLQGAIMGMRQAEIRARFGDIVEFAGVSDFIDTPVKRYSSGMNARLGFSIAAHLDPEVLLIDEVLSVGDLSFQTRAFERLRSMVRSGVPVVVVSHQLDRISSLCQQAIFLRHGTAVVAGTPEQCIREYTAPQVSTPADAAQMVTVAAMTADPPDCITSGQALRVVCQMVRHGDAAQEDPSLGIRVRSGKNGQLLYARGSAAAGLRFPAAREFVVDARLKMNLPAGHYFVDAYLWDPLRQRELPGGKTCWVEVLDAAPFAGSVQLGLEMEVRGVRVPEPSSMFER